MVLPEGRILRRALHSGWWITARSKRRSSRWKRAWPGSPTIAWLLTRKAVVETHLKRFEPAKADPARPAQEEPRPRGRDDPLDAAAAGDRGPRRVHRAVPAGALGDAGGPAAGAGPAGRSSWASRSTGPGCRSPRLKHLELAAAVGGRPGQGPVDRPLDRHSLRTAPQSSVWEKNPYRLRPPPEGVTDAFRESFGRAMEWAEEGLWASAASAFELLSAGSSAGADRRPQPRRLLPVDRRPRGRHRGPAPIHRTHRADDRRGRPRGPLPAPRGRPGSARPSSSST